MSARYEVTFTGHTVVVYRHVDWTRRRWWGLLPDVGETDTSVLGIYPCEMALSMDHALNAPSVLTLSLGGREIVIEGRA